MGKRLRESAEEKGKFIPNRIFEDYEDLEFPYKEEKVIGSAGDLVVFDTDTFHRGGLVEDGKERVVLRMHSK